MKIEAPSRYGSGQPAESRQTAGRRRAAAKPVVSYSRYATAVSLELPEDLPFEAWQRMGAEFGRAGTRLAWLIGDWWRFGWHRYGERKQAVESWGGLAFHTWQRIAAPRALGNAAAPGRRRRPIRIEPAAPAAARRPFRHR
jgi:hypothetical protein